MTRNDLLTFDGITQSIAEWALDYGIPAGRIVARLHQGMAVERAITTPIKAKPGVTLDELDPTWQKLSATVAPEPRPATAGRKPDLHTIEGQTMTLEEWCAAYNVTPKMIAKRLSRGWTLQRALERGRIRNAKDTLYPVHGLGSMTLHGWAAWLGISYKTFMGRVYRNGSVANAITKATQAPNTPGVVADLPTSPGTGGGSVARDRPKIEFFEDGTYHVYN